MNDIPPGAAVVVGIDGSKAAVEAAEWAVDEAIARDVALRLVCVTSARPPAALFPNEIGLEVEYAETVLRQAVAAVDATGKDVKVDVAIVPGGPAPVLLAESRTAELVCVGSSGIGAVSSRLVGSTATTLAEEASCPVAIIRHDDGPRRPHTWIAVAIRASTDDEELVVAAMREARLRHAPVVAIGLWRADFGYTPYDELVRLMESWRQRYPDVRIYPVTTRSGLVQFLNDDVYDEIGMVVVGPDEAKRVAKIVGPHDHPILGHPECSVLVVRH